MEKNADGSPARCLASRNDAGTGAWEGQYGNERAFEFNFLKTVLVSNQGSTKPYFERKANWRTTR